MDNNQMGPEGDNINFNNVSNDIKGCGFRHEEFPGICINEEDRSVYIKLSRQKDYLRNNLFDIPNNLPAATADSFVRGLIFLRMDVSLKMDSWWENAGKKYNLPRGAKYNPHINKIYRHITEDNRVTYFDRNPNFNPQNRNGSGSDNRGDNAQQGQWRGQPDRQGPQGGNAAFSLN
jgi:hypothetical protein